MKTADCRFWVKILQDCYTNFFRLTMVISEYKVSLHSEPTLHTTFCTKFFHFVSACSLHFVSGLQVCILH